MSHRGLRQPFKILDTKIFLAKDYNDLPHNMTSHNRAIIDPYLITPVNLEAFLFPVLILHSPYYPSHQIIIGKLWACLR